MNKPFSKKIHFRYIPYFFILPYFLIYISFSLFPVVYTFYVSLTEWSGFTAPVFVGLKNYATLLKDERFYDAMGNTLIFMGMIIPVQIVLGMLTAVILSSKKMIVRDAYRLMNFLPYITTPVAMGILFAILFDWQFGMINLILSALGITKDNINWIGQPWPARFMISAITIWKYYGYTAVLFLAGITNISPDLYEAAEIDGANSFQRFTYITMPLLRPVVIFVVLTTMIGCFQIFDEPFMILAGVAGGPENSCLTGVWLLYDTAFGTIMKFGYGSAIAYMMFVFIALISISLYRVMQQRDEV